MTLEPAAASLPMFCAKLTSPLSPEAKARLAPGAMSWMFSSIARPSSEPGASPIGGGRSSWITCTLAGRSPVATESASPLPTWLTLSDRTPTFTPVPSTPYCARACGACMFSLASLSAIP